tara:strand:- start:197 stop:535 length:339 start_codon:yes stop_codon:yes gene_type:complete
MKKGKGKKKKNESVEAGPHNRDRGDESIASPPLHSSASNSTLNSTEDPVQEDLTPTMRKKVREVLYLFLFQIFDPLQFYSCPYLQGILDVPNLDFCIFISFLLLRVFLCADV